EAAAAAQGTPGRQTAGAGSGANDRRPAPSDEGRGAAAEPPVPDRDAGGPSLPDPHGHEPADGGQARANPPALQVRPLPAGAPDNQAIEGRAVAEAVAAARGTPRRQTAGAERGAEKRRLAPSGPGQAAAAEHRGAAPGADRESRPEGAAQADF